jgi:hypothetical protein
LSNAFSIAKPSDEVNLVNRIFETSDAFNRRRLIVTFIKPNANIPLSNSEAEMHTAESDSQERQPNDRIIDINPLPSLPFQEAHTITPSLSIKFIGESISKEAKFAPTIFQAFKFIVALTSIADFQLIVDLFLNPHREGVEYFRNISSNKIRLLIVEHIFFTNKSDISAFQLIVEFNQQHQSKLQQDLADAWSFIATISIANLETANNFQQRVMQNRIHQLIVKLTPNTDSEGVLAQENIINATGVILTSEGARVPSSKLIVGYQNSKISLHLCDDCRIFCEGVQGNGNGVIKEHPSGTVSLAFALLALVHIGLVGNIGLGVSFIDLSFVGFISLVGLVGMPHCPHWLHQHMSLVLVGQISLVSISGHIDRNGLDGFIGLGARRCQPRRLHQPHWPHWPCWPHRPQWPRWRHRPQPCQPCRHSRPHWLRSR